MNIEYLVTARIACKRKFPRDNPDEAAMSCHGRNDYSEPKGRAVEDSFEDRAAACFRKRGWIVGDGETTRCPSCARFEAGERPGPVVRFLADR